MRPCPAGARFHHGLLDILHHGKRIRMDANGILVVNDGTPTLDLPGYVVVTGGGLEIDASNKTVVSGGSAFIPFPMERFSRLALAGDMDRLLAELCAPVIYVAERRIPKLATATEAQAPVSGGPPGKDRYPLLCDVCKSVIAGHCDLPVGSSPPTKSGLLCLACAALPVDGWCVLDVDDREVFSGATRADALDHALGLRNQRVGARVIAHAQRRGGAPEFFFGD